MEPVNRIKKAIVVLLEHACSWVDRLPEWTYVGRWIGCPRGLAALSARLDDRWGTGQWGTLPSRRVGQLVVAGVLFQYEEEGLYLTWTRALELADEILDALEEKP